MCASLLNHSILRQYILQIVVFVVAPFIFVCAELPVIIDGLSWHIVPHVQSAASLHLFGITHQDINNLASLKVVSG